MADPVVTYESKDRVATITLNRPDKMNALSNQLVVELKAAFQRLQDSDDRACVLTAAGDRAFSVGADLKDPPRDPSLWECMPGVGVMLDKPVVAAVHGYCVGGAYCLVEFSDLAVADETADFFYPEAQIGFCGGLIAGLAARVAHKHAMEFMLTGVHYKAERAYEVGFVNKVTPKGEHIAAAHEYARILADSAPLVVRALKRFTRDVVIARGPSELSALAQSELLAISRSEDQQEGGRAFREKRKPEFTGR